MSKNHFQKVNIGVKSFAKTSKQNIPFQYNIVKKEWIKGSQYDNNIAEYLTSLQKKISNFISVLSIEFDILMF